MSCRLPSTLSVLLLVDAKLRYVSGPVVIADIGVVCSSFESTL